MFAVPAAIASAEDAVVVLDGWCAATQADPKAIERLARSHGAQPIPAARLDAVNPEMSKTGGAGWVVDVGGRRYAVLVNSIGGCSVFAPGITFDAATRALERAYEVSSPRVDTSGPQVARMYKIGPQSLRYAGHFVSEMSAKPGFARPDDPVVLSFATRQAVSGGTASRSP